MKRWMAWVCCLVFTGAALYTGYAVLEHALIQKELQADIQAEQDYLASLQQSRLSAATKQSLIQLSDQHITQLQQAAQASTTLKQYHQQKEQILTQEAQTDELKTILAKEQTYLH